MEKKRLRIIRGGKDKPLFPEPKTTESDEKRYLRNAMGLLRCAIEMNGLNRASPLPWVVVKRAELVEEDLTAIEKVLTKLWQSSKI